MVIKYWSFSWIAIAAGCLVVAGREWQISSLEAVAATGTMGVPVVSLREDCRDGCDPRVALATARLVTLEALATPAGRRRQDALADADALVTQSLAVRPGWSAALIERSYVAAHRFGAVDPRTARLLMDSYRAPYVLRSAEWRVALADRSWRMLPRAGQKAALAEALWYARLDPAHHARIEAMFTASGMVRRFRLCQQIDCLGSPPEIAE